MKKFITLLLLLVGGMSQSWAATYKIYIKSSNPTTSYIYVWGANVTSGHVDWPGELISSLGDPVTIYGSSYYVKEVVTTGTFNFKCSDTSSHESGNWENCAWDDYVEYNGGTTMTDVTDSNILANCVALPGSHNNWKAQMSIFEKSGDIYTYVLNETTTEFKIYAFGNWKNASKVNCTPADWFSGSDNITLKNDIGYNKFTFTANVNAEDDSKWDLAASVSAEDAKRFTIAGNAAIVNGSDAWTINAANDMSDADLDGVFTLEVKNVSLTAGDYKFRAYRDGTMSGWQVPSDDDWVLHIASDGDYNILYTLTPYSYTLTAQAIPVSVGGTISASGWNTFSSNYKLDLSTVTNGKAFVASAAAGSTVTLTSVEDKIVDAGTGLMIKGTTGKNFTISTTFDEATFSGTNKLVGLPDGGTVAKNSNNYVFGWTNAAEPGFYYIDNTEPTLAAGKSYLHTDSPLSARLFIDFEENGDVTGIANVNSNKEFNGDFYNLNGQKVQNPTKGLYIVNGKKAIIK